MVKFVFFTTCKKKLLINVIHFDKMHEFSKFLVLFEAAQRSSKSTTTIQPQCEDVWNSTVMAIV